MKCLIHMIEYEIIEKTQQASICEYRHNDDHGIAVWVFDHQKVRCGCCGAVDMINEPHIYHFPEPDLSAGFHWRAAVRLFKRTMNHIRKEFKHG